MFQKKFFFKSAQNCALSCTKCPNMVMQLYIVFISECKLLVVGKTRLNFFFGFKYDLSMNVYVNVKLKVRN